MSLGNFAVSGKKRDVAVVADCQSRFSTFERLFLNMRKAAFFETFLKIIHIEEWGVLFRLKKEEELN